MRAYSMSQWLFNSFCRNYKPLHNINSYDPPFHYHVIYFWMTNKQIQLEMNLYLVIWQAKNLSVICWKQICYKNRQTSKQNSLTSLKNCLKDVFQYQSQIQRRKTVLCVQTFDISWRYSCGHSSLSLFRYVSSL